MTTYISKESISVAVPDVTGAKALFYYNFYTIDESSPRMHTRGSSLLAYGASSFSKRMLQDAPRYVEVSFDNNHSSGWADETIIRLKDTVSPIFDEERGKFIIPVQTEVDINTAGSAQFVVQDIDLTPRLQAVVIDELEKIFSGSVHDMQVSQTDMTSALNRSTSNKVSGMIINALVSDFSSDGVTYYDRNNQAIGNEIFADASNVKYEIQFDQKFAGDAASIMLQDPLSATKTGLRLASRTLAERQQDVRVNPLRIGPEDYAPKIDCFESTYTARPSAHRHGVCGYVVDKFVLTLSGRKEFVKRFFLEGSSTTSVVDTGVAYGFTYIYEVRTFNLVEMDVSDDYFDYESRQIVDSRKPRVLFAVLSRPTKQVKVKCVDTVAPPPPDLLTFRFDYSTEKLVIDWKFPHTKQRDIKKFQVFKRRSINEGFTLIAQYDFLDAIFELPTIERVSPEVDFRASKPITQHIDDDFDKSGDAIYAIVSVDAHHLTSNYSDQIRVKFNRSKNLLETISISPLGAPKQYPNFLISSTEAQNIETIRYTEDVMRDSGHQKMRIYLDPEVLFIERGEMTSGNVAVSRKADGLEKGSYKFQILNVDRQKMKILDVLIEDKRI